MDASNKQTILEQLQGAFQAEKATGVKATIQLKLTGENAGLYYLTIQDKTITGGEGAVEKPRLTVTANSKDLLDVFNGKLDPMSAYFQGKFVVQGDLNFAMSLVNLFKKPKK